MMIIITSSNFAGGSVHPVQTAGGYIDQFTSSTVQQRADHFLPINSSCTIKNMDYRSVFI